MAEADQQQPEGQIEVPKGSPNKRLRSATNSRSPIKLANDDDDTPTKRRSSPRKKPAAAENVNDAIKNILANMAPPTEEEVRQTRGPKSAPSPDKTVNSPGKADNGAKMFPIFGSGFAAKGSDSAKKKRKCQQPMTSTTTTTTDDGGKSGLKQAVIDAGQKKIGAEHCLLCDFVYTIGDSVVRSSRLKSYSEIP